jgi:hypothetical protein
VVSRNRRDAEAKRLKLSAVLLVMFGVAAAAQTIPPEQGDQPGQWDSGTPIESAVRCRGCHDRDSTFEETLYMPFDGWVGSMMANSQRDPLFRAALSVANQDVPNVGQWCLRCHSPQAYVRGHVMPPDAGGFDAIDFEGVSCDVCHRSKVPANVVGAPFVGNAQIYFEASTQKLGPYPDLLNSAHQGQQSSFTGSSELCGQCHSVHNPIGAWRAADGGTLAARFPLDTTYEEWKQSAFAQPDAGFASCADCHLPRFGGPDGGTIYRVAKLGEPRERPRQHALAGGNVWGLDAVQAANPTLAAEFAEQFALTKKFTLENLKGAATLELTAPTQVQAGTSAAVTVRVTNRTGHKLPTGYADGRRVVVQLMVDGEVVTGGFDAGALLPDSQLRVYEVQHGRAGVGVEEHLALHDAIVKDSRIPPRGFTPTAQTKPFGVGWFDLSDGGIRDFDESSFNVPLKAELADGAKVTITARLLFQSTTPEYIHFLASENRTDESGRRLQEIYEATGKGAPIEMAKAQAELTVSRPSGAGGGGASPADGCHCASAGFLWSGAIVLWACRLRRRPRSSCAGKQ